MLNKREGEIVIDHRASPGLPADIAIRAGYDPSQVKEGQLFEAATLTCAHCKNVVVKNPLRIRARNDCGKCGFRYVCDFCYEKMQHPDYVHISFEKKADIILHNANICLI